MCLAIPGQILSIEGEELNRRADVSFGGVVKGVSLACLPEAVVGDYVIVHVGLALSRLDEAAAEQMLDDLRQIIEQTGVGDEPGPG